MGFFDDSNDKKSEPEDNFGKMLREQLRLKECKLEDGTMVSNMEGICQAMIGRALNGDLAVVELMNKLMK